MTWPMLLHQPCTEHIMFLTDGNASLSARKGCQLKTICWSLVPLQQHYHWKRAVNHVVMSGSDSAGPVVMECQN